MSRASFLTGEPKPIYRNTLKVKYQPPRIATPDQRRTLCDLRSLSTNTLQSGVAARHWTASLPYRGKYRGCDQLASVTGSGVRAVGLSAQQVLGSGTKGSNVRENRTGLVNSIFKVDHSLERTTHVLGAIWPALTDKMTKPR